MADNDCTLECCFVRGMTATFERLEQENGKDEAGVRKIEAKLAAAAGHAPNGVFERDEIEQLVLMSRTTLRSSGSRTSLHNLVVDGTMNNIAGSGAKAITMQQWMNRPPPKKSCF